MMLPARNQEEYQDLAPNMVATGDRCIRINALEHSSVGQAESTGDPGSLFSC